MREINMNEFYMGININQRYNIIMFFKIQKSEKDEPQSQFFQFNQPTLYFALFTILGISHTTNIHQTLIIVFYLVNILLENSTILRGFDIRP